MFLPRLLILPALAVLVLSLPASPARAVPPTTCPCWDTGGPFYTPGYCYSPGNTRFGFIPGLFAQTVSYGPVSYCRINASFSWTTPAQHQACVDSLHLACSPIKAVAYTDRNGNDAFDHGDGLIAKLVDTDASGDVSVGDDVVVGEFPLDPTATVAGGTFAIHSEAVLTVNSVSPSFVSVKTASVSHQIGWQRSGTFLEAWFAIPSTGPFVELVDNISNPFSTDSVHVGAGAPFGPSPAPVFSTPVQPGDQNFLDVDITP